MIIRSAVKIDFDRIVLKSTLADCKCVIERQSKPCITRYGVSMHVTHVCLHASGRRGHPYVYSYACRPSSIRVSCVELVVTWVELEEFEEARVRNGEDLKEATR